MGHTMAPTGRQLLPGLGNVRVPATRSPRRRRQILYFENPEFHSRSSPYRRTESMAEPRCHYHRRYECTRGHLRVVSYELAEHIS
jgi:hypothetical protein